MPQQQLREASFRIENQIENRTKKGSGKKDSREVKKSTSAMTPRYQAGVIT
jgi:hypothetical protein